MGSGTSRAERSSYSSISAASSSSEARVIAAHVEELSDALQPEGAAVAEEMKEDERVAPAKGSLAHWEPIDPAHGNTSLVLLSKDNPKHAAEIAAVEKGWTETGGLGKIVSIHRVQNLHLHQRYEAKKAKLGEAGHLTRANVRVYHGTCWAPPSLVHSGTAGFDPSLGYSKLGIMRLAEYASDSSSGDDSHWVQSATMPFDGLPAAAAAAAAAQPAAAAVAPVAIAPAPLLPLLLPGSWLFAEELRRIQQIEQQLQQIVQRRRGRRSNNILKQIFQARILLDSAGGSVAGNSGIHLVLQSALCCPDYLITFQ